MDRVVVTGGAGFLGSHLCERLVAAGHEAVALDNEVTGRRSNLDPVLGDDRFTYRYQDVSNPIEVDGPVDWVVHLASLASPVFYTQRPIETLEVGGPGTFETLTLAREKDASYLFASTSEVYGDPEVHPQHEGYRGNVDPFGPRSCYEESKRYGEALVRAFKEDGLDVRVPRLFNTYGPRMRLDDGRVVPTFVRQALRGNDLTVHGDGRQTRSFCYVSDMIDGLLALMRSDVTTPVNLGNPDERTIAELAELVIELTGGRAGITYEPRPPQDPEVRRPDISKARSAFDWEPTVSLRDGLERSIAYFSEQLEADLRT